MKPYAQWLEDQQAHREMKADPNRRMVPRARTPQRAKEDRIYRARVKVWLTLPKNKWCGIWLAKRGLTSQDVDETGMAGWTDDGVRVAARCPRATVCHHKNKRTGWRLLDESQWLAVSWDEHEWIGGHYEEARSIGVLI